MQTRSSIFNNKTASNLTTTSQIDNSPAVVWMGSILPSANRKVASISFRGLKKDNNAEVLIGQKITGLGNVSLTWILRHEKGDKSSCRVMGSYYGGILLHRLDKR